MYKILFGMSGKGKITFMTPISKESYLEATLVWVAEKCALDCEISTDVSAHGDPWCYALNPACFTIGYN